MSKTPIRFLFLLSLTWVILFYSGIGCDSKPFKVLAPDFQFEAGNALVSVRVPSFSRGLIQRVQVRVTEADTGQIQPIERDLNFPIPGGNLAVGEVIDIAAGRRRFRVTAFDTDGTLRFRGTADSVIVADQTRLISIRLVRIGGKVDFQVVIDTAEASLSVAELASLSASSVLDILEVIEEPHHPDLNMLPLASVSLGDGFSSVEEGLVGRLVTISQIPTGTRQFVAHLRDLSSGSSRAFADTVVVDVDTLDVVKALLELEQVRDAQTLADIFAKETLPRDSTVTVIVPEF